MKTSTNIKSFRGIYELDSVEEPHKAIQKKNWNNLTLIKLDKIDSNEVPSENKNVDIDRPLTPINEAVLVAPKTYNQLTRFVQKRVKPRLSWTHISIDDQYAVGEVLLAEVNAVWTDFRKQIDDPFLTVQQNKELRRRITVYIVTVCEQLFLYFCEHVKVLNARDVFSKDANISRICGQAATTAGKCFNLLKVRRLIIEDLRQNEVGDPLKIFARLNPISPKKLKATMQNSTQLNYRNFIKTPKSKKSSQGFNLTQELQDLKRRMPALNFQQAGSLLPFPSKPQHIAVETKEVVQDPIQSLEHIKPHHVTSNVKKWSSEPILSTFQISSSTESDDDDDESPLLLTQRSEVNVTEILAQKSWKKNFARSSSFSKAIDVKAFSAILPQTPKLLNDLDNLMQLQSKSERNVADFAEDGIPSLIRVITRYQTQDAKMKKLKSEELSLISKENEWKAEERKPLPPPKYPQPPFNQTKIPGRANNLNKKEVTIRSSDVHVPHKVDLPSISLEINQPLYNDLTGEISPSTVKELDANLFQDEDLKEVYSEIMKTVTDDHLSFDNDNSLIKPIESMNLKKLLASTTLHNPPSTRLINPDLQVKHLQPHRPVQLPEVSKISQKPDSAKSDDKKSVESSHTRVIPEQPSRAVTDQASWMAWWKATINTDDYFKYLSTKETDFLGVIYHFYDSENSESEYDAEERRRLQLEKEKMELFMNEIKKKKQEFEPGLWNVNVVRLGGLGNYPALKDGTLSEYLESLSDDEAANIFSIPSFTLPRDSRAMKSFISLKATVTSSDVESGLFTTNTRSSLISDKDRMTPCPRGGKLSESSEVESDDSSLMIVDKFVFPSVESFNSIDDHTSGYFSQESVKSRLFEIEKERQSLYFIHSSRSFKPTSRGKKSSQIEQESEYDGVSGVPSVTGTAPSLPSTELQVNKTLQTRFEAVWHKLKMSSMQKLNAAAKYSSDKYIHVLDEIITSWEHIVEVIEKREKLLNELEIFELDASDPQRHFHKGSKGSSATRLKEAKIRAKFYRQLERTESILIPILHSLYTEYGDVITLAGRPYHEKMNVDKIEMLYWLQQERRAVQLNKVGEPEQLKQFVRDNHVTAIRKIAPEPHFPISFTNVKINQET